MDFLSLQQKMRFLNLDVLKDANGNNDVMVKIPLFYLDEYMVGAPHVPHPAFVVDGVVKDHFYIAKYGASIIDGKARSVQFQTPAQNITYSEAVTLSEAKGSRYHLTTNAEWAAVAMLSYFNNKLPTGNSDFGRSFNSPNETGMMAANKQTTLTGTGPSTWSTTRDNSGVMDMSGNLYEHVSGVRFAKGGVIKLIKDNNASKQGINKSIAAPDESIWSNVSIDGKYIPSNDVNGVKFGVEITQTPKVGNAENRLLSNVVNTMTDTYLLKALGLLPFTLGDAKQKHWFYVRDVNADSRAFVRGGAYDSGEYSGIFAVNVQTLTNDTIKYGFRFSFI